MNEKSDSWEDLQPLRVKGNDEDLQIYLDRIRKKKEYDHIPDEVFEQWLYCHHNESNNIANYGWIDYKKATFEISEWTNEQLSSIYVIKEFRPYYKKTSGYKNISEFRCLEEDMAYWQVAGTWRTPPIILDVNSVIGHKPKRCDLKPPYQLVEGHSRLGNLCSFLRIAKSEKLNIAGKHKIYLMQLALDQFT